jgi:hypothetical protein
VRIITIIAACATLAGCIVIKKPVEVNVKAEHVNVRVEGKIGK